MKKNNSLFIGRWQPFHNGHKTLIETVLKKNKPVIIAIRDTKISKENPYTIDQRWKMIQENLIKYISLVKIVIIPDIDEICYGRHVGYGIRQIDINEKIKRISGTKIRKMKPEIIWLTGNTGSGKTTIAYLLSERIDGIILDGDEMRASISIKAGFSKEEREKHNIRVARLAKVIHRQRRNIIVSVIAPFQSTRDKIEKIIKPKWIYIKKEMDEDINKPYEEPKNPFITIDTDMYNINESVEQIWETLYGKKSI